MTGVSYISSSLTSFSLQNGLKVTDMSDLSNCINLTTVSITNSGLSDTSLFANLSNLTSLTLNNNTIYDLTGIYNTSTETGLSNLTYLSLKNNSLSESSLKNIAGLRTTYGKLKTIYLSGNSSISDWSTISSAFSSWSSSSYSATNY